MTATELANALDLKPRGHRFRGPCPVHGGGSEAFVVSESDRENPLVYCHKGCEFREIVAALKDRGLWTDDRPRTPSEVRESKRKQEIAKAKRMLEAFDKVHANDSTPTLDSDWRKRDWAIATLRRHGEC